MSQSDRLPPQSLEAERACLASMLLSPEKASEIRAIVGASDFFTSHHIETFAAMERVLDRRLPLVGVALVDELKHILPRMIGGNEMGTYEFLLDLQDAVPHGENGPYYASVVREASEKRKLISCATDILVRCYAGRETVEEISSSLSDLSTDPRPSGPEKGRTPSALPTPLSGKSLEGLAGELVQGIKPETEACREAILAQLLVLVGIAAGRGIHWIHEATIHRPSLFLCLFGPSGVGRKGTSWDISRSLISRASSAWGELEISSGLTSGEGLIREAAEAKGPMVFVESEFARLLSNMGREGNNLSSVLRQAWEGSRLRVPRAASTLACDEHHLGICAHITEDELRARLGAVDVSNGFVNRFLWVHTYRDGYLPEGGDFDAAMVTLDPHLRDLAKVADFADGLSRKGHRYRRDAKANELFREVYKTWLTAPRVGAWAAASSRAAPLVVRLSMIFAILDRAHEVKLRHLERALDFFRYCDESSRYLFDAGGMSDDLGKIVAALGEGPMMRSQIYHGVFRRHLTSDRINTLLHEGLAAGSLAVSFTTIRGRDRELWHLKEDAQ